MMHSFFQFLYKLLWRDFRAAGKETAFIQVPDIVPIIQLLYVTVVL